MLDESRSMLMPSELHWMPSRTCTHGRVCRALRSRLLPPRGDSYGGNIDTVKLIHIKLDSIHAAD